MNNIRKMIFDARIAVCSLTIYRSLRKDDIILKFAQLLDNALKGKTDEELIWAYHDLFCSLVNKAESSEGPLVGNIWQDYLLNLIAIDENPFSLRCEKGGLNDVNQHLIKLTERDLAYLKILYDFNFHTFISLIQDKWKDAIDFPMMYTACDDAFLPYPQAYFKQKQKIKMLLSNSLAWNQNINDLAEFYRNNGCGEFARYWAFKWVDNENGGKLVGIRKPDPIRLKDLIGYEDQKNEVLRNTRQFIKGFGANNMLLYGDRGTGKSSTIKALVHEFGQDGLRIVEVTKDQLTKLSDIIQELSDRPYHFIVFVDDLSFEEHEVEYKYLKAVLEGSLEPAPENVLIYATSNRRHLIREYYSDREEDEVKAQDTLQEKLSLSDRFGITVIYLSPNQEEYLNIVEGIAKNKGIDIEPKKLRQMAIKWELWHNRRSGRTARQFVEDLLGRMSQVSAT